METSPTSSTSTAILYSFQATCVISGLALAILGGLRLAGVMKGINGMRFIQIGSGLGAMAILPLLISATKKRCESQKESNPVFSDVPSLTAPNLAASVNPETLPQRGTENEALLEASLPAQETQVPGSVDAIPIIQTESEAPKWRALRELNQAMHIPPDDFQELVEFLKTHGVFLEAIENGSLLAQTTLNLRLNNLREIPNAICFLEHLTYLDLYHNELQRLPESFGALTALQTLYLNNNQLETLPESFGDLTALQTLSLNNNKLETLPESFGGLTALQTLYLSSNKLQRLPKSFGSLTALETLYLSSNKLQRLPESFWGLTALQELILNNNQLTQLPNISPMDLSFLDITFNPNLTTLPLSLSNCTQLTHIDTEGTEIPHEIVTRILGAAREARSLERDDRLPAKLRMWRSIGEIGEEWQQLEDHTQIINLYEWLLRLEKTKDFRSCQAQMVNITCQILTTVFNDDTFTNQFFDLIAADLTACGDRAAMSLNLVCTEWRLHKLPKNAPLSEIAALLVGYGRTLKLREIIARDHGDKNESVERFLYAEVSLRERLQLVTAVQNMFYVGCGTDVDLETVEAEVRAPTDGQLLYQKTIFDADEAYEAAVSKAMEKRVRIGSEDLYQKAIESANAAYEEVVTGAKNLYQKALDVPDAEHIYKLPWWQNYLNQHYSDKIEPLREKAEEAFTLIDEDRNLSEQKKLDALKHFQTEQPRMVYLPITQELLANPNHED